MPLTMSLYGGAPAVETPSQDELDAFNRVWNYLQTRGCADQPAQPQVRRAVDTFNELVDPTTKPLDPRAMFLGGCNPCGGADGVNRAAELYAEALAFFKAGSAYYAAEMPPAETPAPTVEDQLTAIATSIAAIEATLTSLEGRVTVLEAPSA